ncbi:MAG: ATP-binding cassette domain-containing protein [Chitinophagales bacterium]|nr:ATP-binding cassette domain-containing protein [Bacteroidota bacterium]MCB9256875.1 ATP-binding cassette domain-containing protein [Chitinophagales bacterium]
MEEKEASIAKEVILLGDTNIYQDESLILNKVTLSLKAGEFVYLIGKTGSGKSSLLKTLYADIPLNNGIGKINDFDLRKLKNKDIPMLRRSIGIVFQDFELLTDRSVFENLSFVLEATGWQDKKKMQTRIEEVLNQVGLKTKHFKMPYELSGGEQQRVVIARALLNEPPLILADEPTGNLDPDTSDDIMKLLFKINKDLNTAVLMATHNYTIIEKFPGRIIKCSEGALHEDQGMSMSF